MPAGSRIRTSAAAFSTLGAGSRTSAAASSYFFVLIRAACVSRGISACAPSLARRRLWTFAAAFPRLGASRRTSGAAFSSFLFSLLFPGVASSLTVFFRLLSAGMAIMFITYKQENCMCFV